MAGQTTIAVVGYLQVETGQVSNLITKRDKNERERIVQSEHLIYKTGIIHNFTCDLK